MKKQNCCICNSEEASHYKTIGKYNLVKCKECGLVRLDNIYIEQEDFIEDAKQDLRKKDKVRVEYYGFPELYNKYKRVFRGFFKERLERIKKYHPYPKTILDVGCGYGFWMRYCNQRGLQSEGIDISSESINYAKQKFNLNVWNIDLMNFETEKKYDAILMFDVLEHLEDPNKALIKCKSMLDKNGLIYLQVPNIFGYKLPRILPWNLPYHLWQFTSKTLIKLLEKNGFIVLEHWTGPMGIIGEYEKNKYIFFKKILWGVASKLYLGNRMQIIAKAADKVTEKTVDNYGKNN